MKGSGTVYRKNFSLIVAFLILVTVTLIIGLIVAYKFTAQTVENDFSTKKNSVADPIINSYTDFSNKIQDINVYSGLLDSASAANYTDSVFHNFSFVSKIVFYQIVVGNQNNGPADKKNLNISLKSIYQYYPKDGKPNRQKNENEINQNDFMQMADKFSDYIASYDSLKGPRADASFETFYDARPGKIIFLNEPTPEVLKTYHDLQKSGHAKSFYKQQNMMVFYVDPNRLKFKNIHPELYQRVSKERITYDPTDIDRANTITGEVALIGAFANYKLYFRSPRDFLIPEIDHRFMPVGGVIFLIYFFFVLIGWLIYRNLAVNLKLFKLQYDFINNFTHEFKTPVSVIKIAGSNLKGDNELTDRQRKHYGKILDEEADKLNELMNKLLSFTQLENKSITIKKDKIKIESFVKGYIDTFKIKYPDFKLNYNISEAEIFYTDTVLLGSVFQNLIENAYKYSHPEKRELFINITLEKRNIIFSFIDKGIGIPKNELNNIFKKFYRLENQYNQNGSVGLGLAFCKELVNFMGGDIAVRSKVNQGSEFIVTLPYEN
ncbi:HAMP domain-containing sensor histidine kinase [Mucilaginibacter sp.]|uniref:sensor histidine kinase n=1 Tax=Mucilaginibacter sp. TaxID=1882438 RepID=UPI0026204D84|nr:HAMP domain-containing sensor histidine kinase [Mucilaginibacter sp.]MDB5032619.1 two-component sensor histidine kinase [Mucilaginibacter sp.]